MIHQYISMKWGMVGFEHKEEARPAYFGETADFYNFTLKKLLIIFDGAGEIIYSAVTGKDRVHFSSWYEALDENV